MQSNDIDNEDDWFATNEEQYLRSIEASEPDYEHQYMTERESTTGRIWNHFQESATSVAQLYRDRLDSSEAGALWIPFQIAAGSVTSLYKEASDGIKRTNDMAIHCGYQRRTREIADWARKRSRRYIRREELLAYLAGKPPPPNHATRIPATHPHLHHNHHHHHTHHTTGNSLSAVSSKPDMSHLGLHGSPTVHASADTDLHTFKEALVRRPRAPDLYAFVADEIARNSKRPGSPLDINMDVQNISSKRQRFL